MAVERWRPFASVERWDPFRGLGDIQTEMNRLFDTWPGRQGTSGDRAWLPAVDVHETKDEFVLTLDIPGVTEKDVHLSITGDMLTIKGERQFEREREGNGNTYHRVERLYGKFERSVQLPTMVQTDKVKASYRDGVLTVKLPKAEEVKPREIKIDLM